MSEIKQQPAAQPQPAYAKHQNVTGTEEWSNGIFDCFENSPDNLCTISPELHKEVSYLLIDPRRPQGNILPLLRVWKDPGPSPRSKFSYL
jgi:hypothetical protein